MADIVRRVQEDNRKGGDPNPSHQEQVSGIDGRLRDHKVTIPEEYVDPTPDRDREPLTVEPTTQDDPTDTIDELEIKIFGRDLRPSGLDQEFPRW